MDFKALQDCNTTSPNSLSHDIPNPIIKRSKGTERRPETELLVGYLRERAQFFVEEERQLTSGLSDEDVKKSLKESGETILAQAREALKPLRPPLLISEYFIDKLSENPTVLFGSKPAKGILSRFLVINAEYKKREIDASVLVAEGKRRIAKSQGKESFPFTRPEVEKQVFQDAADLFSLLGIPNPESEGIKYGMRRTNRTKLI